MALITLTSQIGCGTEFIARSVAEKLNYKVFDDKELRQMAVEMGLCRGELACFEQKAPGFFERIFSHRPETYLQIMESVVYQVSRSGVGIIMGHGAQVLLRDFGCALHIYIRAPMEVRIKTIESKMGIDRNEAEIYLYRKDKIDNDFFQFAFHRDRKDTKLYDIVINLEKIGIDSAAAIVCEAGITREAKSCSIQALTLMENRSLVNRIRAGLSEKNLNFFLLQIDVQESGVIHLSGMAPSVQDLQQIRSVVSSVPGVLQVIDDLIVMPVD